MTSQSDLLANHVFVANVSGVCGLLIFCSFASGLKDDLGELPRREASRFRSQVGFWILNTLIFWNVCPFNYLFQSRCILRLFYVFK